MAVNSRLVSRLKPFVTIKSYIKTYTKIIWKHILISGIFSKRMSCFAEILFYFNLNKILSVLNLLSDFYSYN